MLIISSYYCSKASLHWLDAKFDIVALTETWLNSSTETFYVNMLLCYKFYAKSKDAIKGGGVAAFINAEYDVQELKLDMNTVSFEFLMPDINLKCTLLKLVLPLVL